MDNENQIATVAKFLMKCWQTPPGDDEIGKVRLEHLGTKNSELWALEIEKPKDFKPDECAFEIVEAAGDDCEGMGGVQKYAISVYFGDKKRVGRKKRFALDSRDETEDDAFSEPANGKGLLGQMMRHNEAMMKTSVIGFAKIMNMQAQHLEMKDKRVRELEARHSSIMEMQESLMGKQHERELESVQLMRSEERKDEVVSVAKVLLPAVINRVTNKVLPGGDKPGNQMLDSQIAAIASSLTPDQLPALMGALKPEQQVAFMELMKAAKPKDE